MTTDEQQWLSMKTVLTGILTPCRSETPENFITKIGHIDYVAGGNMPSKLLTVRSDVDDLRTLSDDEEDWTYKQGLPSQAHEKRNNQL